jgi:hypothetical protein
MTFYSVSKPYELFYDNSGDPLENGYIYIGEVNQNPITNPITVYWDVNGLYPAAQPIRTLAGYPSRNGSPGKLFVNLNTDNDYSILIQNKNQELIFSNLNALTSNDLTLAGTVNLISDLRAINSGVYPLYVRGHSVIGDGGEGYFEWKDGIAPGTYIDDNGIIIVPTSGDGSGAWIRSFAGRVKFVWYNPTGDGITDDTTAWLSFKSYLNTNDVPGEMHSATFAIDAFTFGQSDSGLNLTGAVYNNANFGQEGTILKLRSASSTFVTLSGCYNMDISYIEFDGGKYADTVVYFPGLETVTECRFERCAFYGATPNTGKVHFYDGTIQIDKITFNQCNITEDKYVHGTSYALNLIHNDNSNALLIWYEHCYLNSADVLIRFGQGSCNFFRCDMFKPLTSMIDIDSVTQPFRVIEPYSEKATGIPFFRQRGLSGVTSNYPIILDGIILNDTNDININCQQIVKVSGYTGGNINVNPITTYGVHAAYIENMGLATGKNILGTGAITNVISFNVTINKVFQPNLLGMDQRIYNASSSSSSFTNPAIGVANNRYIVLRDSAGGLANGVFIGNDASDIFRIGNNNSTKMEIYSNRSIRLATQAIATNTTDGFTYIATCAGTPTGTPTTLSGSAPLIVDTTNNKLYFYSGGSWRDAGP